LAHIGQCLSIDDIISMAGAQQIELPQFFEPVVPNQAK
jgi:hypothetical protein